MEELLAQLAREVQRKYYGKYRGFVVENKDPEKRGRLRLLVPSVLGTEETAWALPCLPFGGAAGHGLFTVPENDAQVWVEFEEGELAQPIWTGTFWQKQGDPPDEATAGEGPTARVLKTPGGHILLFDDEKDKEKLRLVHPSGSEIAIDEKGILSLTDSGGSKVTLDADAGTLTVEDSNGNTLTMTPAAPPSRTPTATRSKWQRPASPSRGRRWWSRARRSCWPATAASRSSRARASWRSSPPMSIRPPWGPRARRFRRARCRPCPRKS